MSDRAWETVSTVFSFPVVATAIAVLAAAGVRPGSPLRWAASYLGVFVVPSIGLTLFYYRTGRITDLDVRERGQRPELMVSSATLVALGLLVVRLIGMDGLIARLGAAQAGLTLLLGTVSVRWKISVHGSFMGALMAVAAGLYGVAAVVVLPFLVLVGISRVRLGHHTPAQYTAGLACGAVVTALAFLP